MSSLAGYKNRKFLCHLWEMAIHIILIAQCLACSMVRKAPVNLFWATKPAWTKDRVLSPLLSRIGVFNVIFLLKFLFLSCTLNWKMVEIYYSACSYRSQKLNSLPFCSAQHQRDIWHCRTVRSNEQMKQVYPSMDAKELTKEWKAEFEAFQTYWPRFDSYSWTSAAV